MDQVWHENAPAKINLALHVTGQRNDGYHLLESLVVFANIADTVHLRQQSTPSFKVSGPFADILKADKSDNLVLRAYKVFQDILRGKPSSSAFKDDGVAITLEKHLPIAAGLGGGSSDAAALLRLLNRFHNHPLTDQQLYEIALHLGADVPMCLQPRPCHVSGIGEKVLPLATFPQCAVVLVNPMVHMATPSVFRALEKKSNPGLALPDEALQSTASLMGWLEDQRNDLQEPALSVVPDIATVLASLRQSAPHGITRMSGSGASCFSLVETLEEADRIAHNLQDAHPAWWVKSASILS